MRLDYQFGACMEKRCKREASIVQFTKALDKIRKGDVQPRWYCAGHSSNHANVSPVNGDPIHRQHKSYLKKEGRFVPLKRVPRGGADGKAA